MNVTPLVDVVLVLLIIFMVLTPQMQSSIAVDLPKIKVDKDTRELQKHPAELTVTAQGMYYFDKRELTLSQMQQHMSTLYSTDKERPVVIKADKQVDFKNVRALLQICQELGLSDVALQVVDAGESHGL